MPEEHEITALRKLGRGENLEIAVDGEPLWKLSRKMVEKLGLAVGQRLSPDALAAIHDTVVRQQTRETALRSLGQRARTRDDLRRRLLSRGHPETTVEETLAWLSERGLLNDELYAQDRTSALQRRRLGGRAIEQKLRQEGVPRELARTTVAQRAAQLPETELARELAAELNARWSGLDWLRRRNRLYQHLARRGFSSETIEEVLRPLVPEDSSDED